MWTGGGAECWHLIVDLDWKEIFRIRASNRVYLQRYGRQDRDAIMLRPIPQVVEELRVLSDIVGRENALSSAQEDG